MTGVGGSLDQATFITLAVPGNTALQALMLARSIREFGGSLASEHIWALVPDGGRSIKTGTQANAVPRC